MTGSVSYSSQRLKFRFLCKISVWLWKCYNFLLLLQVHLLLRVLLRVISPVGHTFSDVSYRTFSLMERTELRQPYFSRASCTSLTINHVFQAKDALFIFFLMLRHQIIIQRNLQKVKTKIFIRWIWYAPGRIKVISRAVQNERGKF